MIEIINNSHPDKNICQYIGNVFKHVLDFFCAHVSPLPPLGIKPIELIYDTKHGPWTQLQNKYLIGINVSDKHPLQVIYQMAHELCHIFIDPRINGVFVEIICHKTAFDMLEDIGEKFCKKTEVDEYITRLKTISEKNKILLLSEIKPNSLYDRIKDLERRNMLFDRNYNNLLALKIKEVCSDVGKYEIINHIAHSVVPLPAASDSLNLTPRTIINFDKLITNISTVNKELAKLLSMLKA